MSGKLSGFDPYKEEKDKRLFERGKEIKSMTEMFNRKREQLANDPLKKVFASQKGGQSRKKATGKIKISLPTLKFLEEKDERSI